MIDKIATQIQRIGETLNPFSKKMIKVERKGGILEKKGDEEMPDYMTGRKIYPINV